MHQGSKFTYLHSILWGGAKSVISGLSITTDNHVVACKLFVNQYNRKERIIFAHTQALLTVNVLTMCNASGLWKLKGTLQSHVRGLEMFNISGKQFGDVTGPDDFIKTACRNSYGMG